MSDDVGAAPTLQVGPSGRARTVSMMLAVVGLPGGALLTVGVLGPEAPSWASIAMLTGQALLTVAPWARMLLRTTVTAGPDGITVVGPRPARGSWPWSEILEVCFARQGAWAIGVRVRGSVWDGSAPPGSRLRDDVSEA